MMNADEMKAIVAAYWRYQRQCPLVALEGWAELQTWGGLADVLCVTKERYLIETEVKVSLSDLKKDIEKPKHAKFAEEYYDLTHYFYFAVPYDIANHVKSTVQEMYPYAGLIGVKPYSSTTNVYLEMYINPRPLSDKQLSLKDLVKMSLNQSATLCRLARDVCKAREQEALYQAQIKQLMDILKLHNIEV